MKIEFTDDIESEFKEAYIRLYNDVQGELKINTIYWDLNQQLKVRRINR